MTHTPRSRLPPYHKHHNINPNTHNVLSILSPTRETWKKDNAKIEWRIVEVSDMEKILFQCLIIDSTVK